MRGQIKKTTTKFHLGKNWGLNLQELDAFLQMLWLVVSTASMQTTLEVSSLCLKSNSGSHAHLSRDGINS